MLKSSVVAVMGEKLRRQKPGEAAASAASRPASPRREPSRRKKQARSGGLRRLGPAWRTPQRWNDLGAHMATGHADEVASSSWGAEGLPPLGLLPAGALPPKCSVRCFVRPESGHATGSPSAVQNSQAWGGV